MIRPDNKETKVKTLQAAGNFVRKSWQLACGISHFPINLCHALRETDAAELLEFALALPLILVMVAGLLDFANAYNTKQKLANAAREGARLGAATPTSGDTGSCTTLNTTVPCSVQYIYNDVETYLTNAGISTSFIGASGSPQTCTTSRNPNGFCWEYNTTTASGTYGMMIERQAQILNADSITNATLLATRVTLTYPYDWSYGFNHIIDLLIPSANVTGEIAISTYAEMANQGQ